MSADKGALDRDTLLALLGLLVVMAVLGGVGWLNNSRDATPGLTYESGDRPQEAPKPNCPTNPGAAPGACGPSRVVWTISAGGSVTTRFILDGPDRNRLTGAMQLRAYQSFGRCPAVVAWAITAQGRTVAGDTVRAGGLSEQPIGAARLLPGDQAVTLTARRTDREPCKSTLLWMSPAA